MASEGERAAKAFKAMKTLGIKSQTVKPVLKNLLKLYDRNWDFIEDDNYRTLADAIFQSVENKLPGKDGDMVDDDSEPPKKKIQILVTEKGKNPISVDTKTKRHKETDLVDNNVIKSVVEQSANCSPPLHMPASHTCPDLSDSPKNIIKQNSSAKVVLSKSAQHINEVSASDYKSNKYSTSVIASSSCKRVKVSFRLDHATGQPNFHHENMAAVLRYTESQYLKKNLIVPQFSTVRFLEELCENYLELDNIGAERSVIKKKPEDYFHDKKKPDKDHRRMVHPAGSLNCRVSSNSGPPSASSQIVQQQATGQKKKKVIHKISDITKGTEKVTVPLLDEVGCEELPNFIYIPENTVYQNAHVHVSLTRIPDEDCCTDCKGDCLSSLISCACTRDTGGDFAYNVDGLLKDEFLEACISMKREPEKHFQFYCQDCPLERAKYGDMPEKCKGHLLRKFIKECWRKCGCNLQCGNRVVQRGITRKLQVFSTKEGKGWGLRALEKLPKGAFVCEYVGEILTNIELYDRNERCSGKGRHTYPVLLDADWGSEGVLNDEEALCLDATYYGNVARFINHRCFDANLIDIPVEVESPDHHYYHIAFFTKRKVDAWEELTWDYGIDFNDHKHPVKAFRCRCGSMYCQDKNPEEMKPAAT